VDTAISKNMSEFISQALDAAQEFTQLSWPALSLKAGVKALLSRAAPNGIKTLQLR